MSYRGQELQGRTHQFAIRVVKLYRALPKSAEAQVLGKQLLRCGTSVAANYRAIQRARSNAEFIAKTGIVIEETDESLFWLELMVDVGTIAKARLEPLMNEANELLRIFVASRNTARAKRSKEKSD